MKTKPKPKPTTTNGRDEAGRFRRGQAPKPKPTPTLVVERVGLHTLHEDPSNPNTHPENDIKDLMAKLATFGQVEPLVIQKSTRKVIGGNGRLEAMRRLGWVQCDVTMVDCDNVTATALGISLNRRKSLFDDSVLVAQLQAIQSENADLMDAVGYDQGEIDALIAGLKADVTPPPPAEDPGPQVDRAEELLAKWKVKTGDLWVIPSKATPGGEHRILCGDSTKAEDVAKACDGQVQMCVTSPPYWGLRDYGDAGQLGLEATPEEFVATMAALFAEVRRVLRDDGTAWVNLGDSYAGGGGFAPDAPSNKRRREIGSGMDGVFHFSDRVQDRQPAGKPKGAMAPGLKPKDLIGIPWRVAFALQADGWYLRSDIIWAKPNPMPESVTDRPTKSHEYVFLLSKNERYFWDQEGVREGFADERNGNPGKYKWTYGDGAHGNRQAIGEGWNEDGSKSGRNIRSVWTITPQPFPGPHFATYPVELAARCIEAGTSEKGCCTKCGKPWERVVERESHSDRPNSRPMGSRGNQPSLNASIGQPQQGGRSSTVETLGWRPTCECFGRFEDIDDEPDNPHVEPRRVYVPDGPQPDPIPCSVLDPFLGAGTTVVAAEQAGRLARGIELAPKYVAVTLERLSGMGLTPSLQAGFRAG